MFCLIAIIISFGIETIGRITEIEKQTSIKLFEMQKTIEAQEKEIRLLRTDTDIILYGYERGQ
jgi:hypothetical protein